MATPSAMFELVQAIRKGELSLDDLKQALGESFEPARHVFNESGTVIFGKPSDSQVYEYGRNLGAVLQAAVSGGGVKIIAKAAPKAAKILSAKGTVKSGTFSNVEARTWYLQQESKIPSMIDKNLSLEQQARQAVDLRNQFRTQARDLMADRELAASLNKTDPNLTWEQVVKKYSDKGFQGDSLYQEIINAAQRSRTSVNESLGIK